MGAGIVGGRKIGEEGKNEAKEGEKHSDRGIKVRHKTQAA
jgi:hypothetical protein